MSMSNGTTRPAVLHGLSIGLTAIVPTLVGDVVRDVWPVESDDGRGRSTEHACTENCVSRIDSEASYDFGTTGTWQETVDDASAYVVGMSHVGVHFEEGAA